MWNFANKGLHHSFEIVHSDSITSIAVTSDNRYIISGSEDKTIAMWDIAQKKLFNRFPEVHSDSILTVTVTRNDKYIISGSADGTIAMWDIAQKNLLRQFEQAHSAPVASVAVTNDNKYFISGSHDMTIAIWDIAERKNIHYFEQAHSESIRSVTVTENGKYIISGSADKTIAVWDIVKKTLLHRFKDAHSKTINSVTATEDSKYIISGSADKTIAMWDIVEKKLLHRLEKHTLEAIYSVAATKDGKYILSGSKDDAIGVWNFASINRTFRPLAQFYLKEIQTDHLSIADPSDTEIGCFPQRWNLLNYVMFYLPFSAHKTNITFAVDYKIYLSFDTYGFTQFDYLLQYHEQQATKSNTKTSQSNPQIDEFTVYFFQMLPKLLNFNSLDRNKLFVNLSKAILTLYTQYGESNFWGVFNALYLDEASEYIENKEILPPSGMFFIRSKALLTFDGIFVGEEQLNRKISTTSREKTLS